MRTALTVLAATLLLAACSGDELKTAAAGTMKSWCSNAPNCDVREER